MSAAPAVRPPRRSTDAVLACVCPMVIGATAWWAIGPSRSEALASEPDISTGADLASGVPAHADSLIALDLAAFRTPIWVAPPLPPVPAEPPPQAKPEPPPPPPPPLKWQLLAIVRGPAGAVLRAMIYDPESDRVLELAAGDAHSGATIESVSDDRVTIRRGRHTHTLLLDPRLAANAHLGPTEGVP